MAYAYDSRWSDNYKHDDNNDAYTFALLLLGFRTVKIYRTCVAVGVFTLFLVLAIGFTSKMCRTSLVCPNLRGGDCFHVFESAKL